MQYVQYVWKGQVNEQCTRDVRKENPTMAELDIYNITAVLLEGPSGTDPDSVPSFSFAGPMVVV